MDLNANVPLEPGSTDLEKYRPEFPIVGIGASAGGLAAFEQLFTNLPPDSGMAFVVVQHLSPPHKSILPEIIQRYTSMPVFQVTDGMQVKPNNVYVIPPGSDLFLQDGHLALLPTETKWGYRLPINSFFRSLAEDQGARAIGVVLSGTGSDGSQGLRNIKAEAGLTIAQQPDTAEFEDMPRNAIATQDVDYILPPQEIGKLILKYSHHQIPPGYKQQDVQQAFDGLHKLYFLLRSKTGHDFSRYKLDTLLRRIERRMKVNLVKNLDDYVKRVQEHPEEIEALFREMLINVTHFFRDPAAYQALKERTISPLIQSRQAANLPVRVWVAGCSSGEEAYSIAIAIQEQIEALKADCKVQIYATDIDDDAIYNARKGFYSDGSLENVSVERLQRFFHQEEDGYQVKKNIRDMVVFSTQNLISDPPFSKIDLICCRNVMIYLEQELQGQLLHQFHYSLNPGGILFLGNSENVTGASDLFEAVDRKRKIFRRKDTDSLRRKQAKGPFVPRETGLLARKPGLAQPPSMSLRELAEKMVLEHHSPACVFVDPKHNVFFIHGHTGKYLEPASGDSSANLLRMAREGLKTELATALHTATTRNETVRMEGIRVKTNGDFQVINLTVRPIAGPPDTPNLIMVVFEDSLTSPVEPASAPSEGKRKHRRVVQLEKALKDKEEYLHTVIDEFEELNLELTSANEELQSTNEELQSTNEELETSKEELQSINEELSTINAELQNKNEELSGLNNDIYNLLNSTEIATLFLDLEIKIRRFTPTIQHIYHFLQTDAGRPLAHFVSELNYDHLVDDAQQVLENLVPKTIEAQAKDGLWYLINLRPYRTLENIIDGVVVTFVDITQQKHLDELLRLATVIQDSNDAITVQDFNGKILAWNRGAAQMYGWSEAEALTMNAMDLIPEFKRAEVLAAFQRLARGEVIRSFETQRVTRDQQVLDVWMTLTVLFDKAHHPDRIASTERDITDMKQAGRRQLFEIRALKAAHRWYQAAFERVKPVIQAKEVCRFMVEESGYRLAWLGKTGKSQAEDVTPVAWAGLEGGAQGKKKVRTLAKLAAGLMKDALSSGRPVALRNLQSNPEYRVGRKNAHANDYGALLVLPLIDPRDPTGVLMIYAREPDAFTDQETEILWTVSQSIVRAVGSLWDSTDGQ